MALGSLLRVKLDPCNHLHKSYKHNKNYLDLLYLTKYLSVRTKYSEFQQWLLLNMNKQTTNKMYVTHTKYKIMYPILFF